MLTSRRTLPPEVPRCIPKIGDFFCDGRRHGHPSTPPSVGLSRGLVLKRAAHPARVAELELLDRAAKPLTVKDSTF
jgi:hypothetical protein